MYASHLASAKFDKIIQVAALLLLATVAFTTSRLWMFSDAGWLHIELLTAPEYIWTLPRGASFIDQFRTLFDWAVFDSSPYRLRMISDFLEIADSVSRPLTIWLLSLHPSLTISTLLLAVFTGLCFFKALRHFGLSTADAALLTAIFLTTIGFLSCYVSYIRPAKRAAVFFICFSLYLIFRFIRLGGNRNLLFALAGILLTLFTDEAGYAFYGIAVLFLLPHLLKGRLFRGAAGLMAVVPVFLIVAKLILPHVYNAIGSSGSRDQVVPTSLVRNLLGYLVEPRFYSVSIEEMSRAALGTFGLTGAHADLSVPFILIFPGLAAIAIFRLLIVRMTSRDAWNHWQFIFATVSVLGMGLFLTLINWNAAPFGYNYYGSISYYYYSPIVVLALLWFASLIKLLRDTIQKLPYQRIFSIVLLAVAVPVTVANYFNFRDVNRLIQTIHIYPLDPENFHMKVMALPTVIASLPVGAPIPLSLASDSTGLKERFYPLSRSLLGKHSIDAENNLAHFLVHPMGTEAYVRAYVRAFYPNREVNVKITEASK